MTTLEHNSLTARARFPRGLFQPAGSLRFGADALLLAAFAARQVEGRKKQEARRQARPLTAAELGCGCGAALLGLGLRCPAVSGLGLEREEALVLAARHNAQALGLTERLRFTSLDLADRAALRQMRRPPHADATAVNALDMVLANPPFDLGGRPSPHALRESALRGPHGREESLNIFCRAAALLLRHQGHFFCIYEASALPHLCAALNAARLGLRRVLPVRARRADPALRVLVEARKNTAHDLTLEGPLTLHAPLRKGQTTGGRKDGAPLWSACALAFCPWLDTA